MRSFEDYNPLAVCCCYACIVVIAMFTMQPVLLVLSLLGGGLYDCVRVKTGTRPPWFYLGILAACALLNPLFNHTGTTVLVMLNDNPITLEALAYGIVLGLMLVGMLWWFRSFTSIMTSDRLLYVFGSASPKLALILSMVFRYIPLYRRQARRVDQAQKGIGLYKEDNLPDRLRGAVRCFSVMVTWALENGITTADSMTARGYGCGRRSRFSPFRFRRSDALLTAVSLLLTAVTACGMACGRLSFQFYPALDSPSVLVGGIPFYISYGILCLIPAFLEISEALKWKYLQSGI